MKANSIQDQIHQVFELIRSQNLMSLEQAEAFAHALHDVFESTEKIFHQIIPGIVQRKALSKEDLWELREEFRHILYHLEEAKLAE